VFGFGKAFHGGVKKKGRNFLEGLKGLFNPEKSPSGGVFFIWKGVNAHSGTDGLRSYSKSGKKKTSLKGHSKD